MAQDGFVHLVAAHAHGAGVHDAGQGDDGHFRGAAADVHHHVGGRLLDGEVGADGRGHGLFDEIDLTGAGAEGGFLHGALFHLGDAGGHADHDARAHEAALVVHLGDEVAEHGFRHLEVGDDAVLHGADGADVAGSAAEHALGLGPHGEHLVVAAAVLLHCHHGGLAQNDALPLDIHAGVCGTKVDSEVIGKDT